MALIIASFIEASAYQKQPLKGEAYLFHNLKILQLLWMPDYISNIETWSFSK